MINTAVTTPLAATADPAKAKQLDKLKAAAHQFEAVFARQMISSMRSAKLGEDILDSDAQDQFRSMSDAKLADSMADKGTFGIADLLVKQFSKQVSGYNPGVLAKADTAATRQSTATLTDNAKVTE